MKHAQWEHSHWPPAEDGMISSLSLSEAQNKKVVPREQELNGISLGDTPTVCFGLPERQAHGF